MNKAKKTDALTDKESRVLHFVHTYTSENRLPPSYREICVGLDYASTNSVNTYLGALESKGYISTQRARARALWLTEKGLSAVQQGGGTLE